MIVRVYRMGVTTTITKWFSTYLPLPVIVTSIRNTSQCLTSARDILGVPIGVTNDGRINGLYENDSGYILFLIQFSFTFFLKK
jgi:hypothetical protein